MSAIAPPTPVLPPAQRRPQVMEYDIVFQPFCFQGTAFPACDFENPEAAACNFWAVSFNRHVLQCITTGRAASAGRWDAMPRWLRFS